MPGMGAVLAVLLVAAVTWERLAIGGPLGAENLAVWVSGLAVVACAVSGRWFDLTARAAVAVGVSWLTTTLVIILGPVEHSWGLGESLALGFLMAQVIRTLPARRAALLGVALGTAAIVAPLRDEHTGPFSTVLGVLTLCVAAAFTYIRVLDAQRGVQIAQARSRERLELARELHDLVAQHITGILMLLRGARNEPTLLDEIETAGQRAMAAMRRLVALLRDDSAPRLDPAASVAAIDWDAQALRRQGIRVDVEVDVELDGQAATGVYRIVREALTNVGKHAHGATHVTVSVTREGEDIAIEVTDDGRGDAEPGSGFGLVGLRERLEELGGTLQSGPRATGGWRVRASLPRDAA